MKTKTIALLLIAFTSAFSISAQLKRSPSPNSVELYIISPANKATIGKTFTVRFGLKGMGVAPANINIINTEHHHLLINAKTLPAEDVPMPMLESLKHFGASQTETELTLAPGMHTLQLVLDDYLHIPHQPAVISKTIKVTIK